MIAFVKDSEMTLERTPKNQIVVDERKTIVINQLDNTLVTLYFSGRIQLLIRGFNSDWKKAIEAINQEIMQRFSNFKNGTAILQVSNEGIR